MSLDDVRSQILADLDETQGPWRRRPLAVRICALCVPALVVIGAAVVVLTPSRGASTSVFVAALASIIGLIGVVLAPEKPAWGERFSQAAVVVALVAFATEVLRMNDVPMGSTAGCLGIVSIVAVAAAVVTAAGLMASRLPLRAWHRVGLATSTTLGACAALWNHCPSAEVVHVLVAHTLGPVALIAAVVAVVGRFRR